MSAPARGGRLRAYLEFIAAVLYFFVVRSFARNAAIAIHRDAWAPLVEQFLFVFFLIVGYAAFGSLFDKQEGSIAAQGLPLRPGFFREVATGLTVGWGAVVVCVLAMFVIGGIAVVITTQSSAWPWLLVDAAYFALLTLGEEVGFRGYGFQRFTAVVGSSGAAFGLCIVLCDRLCSGPRGHQCQHRHFGRIQLSADNGLSAHTRTLGKLGPQFRLESFAGPHLRTHGERCQQPFTHHRGQSHGPLLAHGRRFWHRCQLVCLPGPSNRLPSGLPRDPRTRLPL